jgi:hypothetical protein
MTEDMEMYTDGDVSEGSRGPLGREREQGMCKTTEDPIYTVEEEESFKEQESIESAEQPFKCITNKI